MARPRSTAQVARDRRRIADLYLRGRLQADIAAELGIGQATVSRDLKALRDEWRQSALIDIDAAKARELAKIDHLERAYYEAWTRSQEDAETQSTKAVDTADGKRYEAQTQRRGQAGDPRFLQGVQWCIERRCKILGIDAPAKAELTGKDGGPIRGAIEQRVEHVVDTDRIASILGILAEAGVLPSGPAAEAGEADDAAHDALHPAQADAETGGVPAGP